MSGTKRMWRGRWAAAHEKIANLMAKHDAAEFFLPIIFIVAICAVVMCLIWAVMHIAEPTPPLVQAPGPELVPDRWATPQEIHDFALQSDCIRLTIPGWRRNIGGGPIMLSDLPDIQKACAADDVLRAQLDAIPK